MNEPPIEEQGPPEIPHLDVKSYGDQETFLAMLEVILNGTIDLVNELVRREHAREQAASKIITL